MEREIFFKSGGVCVFIGAVLLGLIKIFSLPISLDLLVMIFFLMCFVFLIFFVISMVKTKKIPEKTNLSENKNDCLVELFPAFFLFSLVYTLLFQLHGIQLKGGLVNILGTSLIFTRVILSLVSSFGIILKVKWIRPLLFFCASAHISYFLILSILNIFNIQKIFQIWSYAILSPDILIFIVLGFYLSNKRFDGFFSK